MQYIVALAFIAILSSLALALFFMLKGQKGESGTPNKMARALALRIGFSVLLFLCILISWKMGWIEPTGIQSGQ